MTEPWLPIEIVIPGTAVGKMRPGIRNRGQFAQHYTPDKTANYESLVAMAGYQAMAGREILDEPVTVTIMVYVDVPASWSKRKRERALTGELRPTGKPDLDNVEKSLFDGLNKVVWRDDAIVVGCSASKWYGTEPRVVMTVRPVDPVTPQLS